MAKNDQIFVGIRNGDGMAAIEVRARQNGRSVTSATEKEGGITWLVLQEVTRGGTVIDEVRAQTSDVVYVRTSRGE